MNLAARRPTAIAATVAAATLVAGALSACSTGAKEDTITFAAVPAESSQSLAGTFGNVAEVIERATGKKVEFQSASDYAAVIEGQRAGQIDIASYGPFSYVIAADGGIDLEPVAAPVNDPAATPAYTSLAYVKKGSTLTDLADARGTKVCFVDAASTSGYLFPSQGLLGEGIDPKTDVEPIMAGGHDASLLAVESGQCDIGFAHDAMLTTLEKSGQIGSGDLVPVWESPKITEDPIALNLATLDPGDVDLIRTALRERANKPAMVADGICDGIDDCVLPEEIEWGYVAVSDSDYDAIRDVCAATEADACRGVG